MHLIFKKLRIPLAATFLVLTLYFVFGPSSSFHSAKSGQNNFIKTVTNQAEIEFSDDSEMRSVKSNLVSTDVYNEQDNLTNSANNTNSNNEENNIPTNTPVETKIAVNSNSPKNDEYPNVVEESVEEEILTDQTEKTIKNEEIDTAEIKNVEVKEIKGASDVTEPPSVDKALFYLIGLTLLIFVFLLIALAFQKKTVNKIFL